MVKWPVSLLLRAMLLVSSVLKQLLQVFFKKKKKKAQLCNKVTGKGLSDISCELHRKHWWFSAMRHFSTIVRLACL